ncbi:uncharacterized protein [Antedon mediterranea]|uniref:uncharacterized protein n=1 Tax=Antedon mediterranea TaxID=105859 RepID=UPI003AF68A22
MVVMLVVTLCSLTQLNAKATNTFEISSSPFIISRISKSKPLDKVGSIDKTTYYSKLQKEAYPGVIFSETKPNITASTSSYDDSVIFRNRRALLRDSCQETSDYELVATGINDLLETVELHANTWVYTTRCLSLNDSCIGVIRIKSACKQKKGWTKAYARKINSSGEGYGAYKWQWISVDRSCNCAISFR